MLQANAVSDNVSCCFETNRKTKPSVAGATSITEVGPRTTTDNTFAFIRSDSNDDDGQNVWRPVQMARVFGLRFHFMYISFRLFFLNAEKFIYIFQFQLLIWVSADLKPPSSADLVPVFSSSLKSLRFDSIFCWLALCALQAHARFCFSFIVAIGDAQCRAPSTTSYYYYE